MATAFGAGWKYDIMVTRTLTLVTHRKVLLLRVPQERTVHKCSVRDSLQEVSPECKHWCVVHVASVSAGREAPGAKREVLRN